MARRAVDELILTQRAIDKAAVHGVPDAQMEAVVANENVLARNQKGRVASHILIGRDDQGRCVAIPVVRADRPDAWWAITAWSCKLSELAKLRERGERSHMHGPIRYESTQEPADDEGRELMDPESWDWDSAEVLPGSGRVLYEVRPLFSSEEYHALAALAERQAADPTEAARRIILDRLATELQSQDVAGVGRGRKR